MGCTVCEVLLTQSRSVDLSLAQQALSKLKGWALGWISGSMENRFLASRDLRDLLFPEAPDSSFIEGSIAVRHAPLGALLQDPGEISPSLEGSLLSGAQQEDDGHQTDNPLMEDDQDESTSETSEADPASGGGSNTFSPRDFMDEVRGLLEGMQAQISGLMLQPTGVSAPTTAPPPSVTQTMTSAPPSSGLTPASAGTPRGLDRKSFGFAELPTDPNPWRPCNIFCLIEKGTKMWTPHGTLSVSDLEFRPSLSSFPSCDFRFRVDEQWQGTHIASEVMILPETEAAKRVTALARRCGFRALGVASFGSRTAILEGPTDAPYPFAGKVLNKALESFHAGFPSITLLEECKPFGVLVPGPSDPFAGWKDIAQIFVNKRLPPDVTSAQLKEAFPKLPTQLLTEEHATRRALSRSLSLQCVIEMAMEDKPTEDMFPVIAKMHSHSLLTDLVAFLKARKACREYVFQSAKVTHETRELIESPMFCTLLFPEDRVNEILARAAKDNKSLLEKWGITSHKRRRLAPRTSGQLPPQPLLSSSHYQKKAKRPSSSTTPKTKKRKQEEPANTPYRKKHHSGPCKGKSRG